MSIPSIVSSIMLLICLIDGLPYGYFNLLRLVVCGTSIFNIMQLDKDENKVLYWIFIFIAILFNPLIPIHLERDIWLGIDLLCFIPMGMAAFKLKKNYYLPIIYLLIFR